jgi:hypothetical protein
MTITVEADDIGRRLIGWPPGEEVPILDRGGDNYGPE